ncbi:hypothetical protein [Chryseobacterium indologenes]|uniref:hypothetical protein n=1 Tax=Chryseobacterium indologenes TaxID=253 RepID=UPI001BD06AAB|nr:hypothetical protein [Chryseobacterium indologenes]
MDEALELIKEFKQIIHDTYGMYHDAYSGYRLMYQNVIAMQSKALSITGLSIDELDQSSWMYGEGEPPEGTFQSLHTVSQGELKERLLPEGQNHIILGHVVITQIYQYWNDKYRGEIETALSMKKNDLKANVFGDIRLMRNSIVHHRAISLKEIEKCKIFQWFKEGDQISFTSDQIKLIIVGCLQVLEKLSIDIDEHKNNPC